MKRIALAVLVAVAISVSVAAATERVFCPICREKGLKSRVYVDSIQSTLLHCGTGFYDEDGVFTPPEPCNTVTYSYSCDKGHEWQGSERGQ